MKVAKILQGTNVLGSGLKMPEKRKPLGEKRAKAENAQGK